jgi:DnaJ-class molecular chaperone
MTISLHKIQPQPTPESWPCGWCHGSGYGGEKEQYCRGCKGVGWITPAAKPDKRIR